MQRQHLYSFLLVPLCVVGAHACILLAIIYSHDEPEPASIIAAAQPVKETRIQGKIIQKQRELKKSVPDEIKPIPEITSVPVVTPKLSIVKRNQQQTNAVHHEAIQKVSQEQLDASAETELTNIDISPTIETTNIEAAQVNEKEFNNTAPIYPTQSRRLHEEGRVLLYVFIKADGCLGDVEIKKSSGYSRLDEAAKRTVKKWHFIPAKRNGQTIDAWFELPIEFSLNG